MKKIISVFLIIIALSIFSASAHAHPPRGLALSWNGSDELTVKVDHPVNDGGKHYVYQLTVYVNDGVVAQQSFSTQADDGMSHSFKIGPQPAGAVVKVEAMCVIMGSASGSITL